MRRFRQISAPFLALAVLLSTSSFNISMHYCMGRLVDRALFSEAGSCSMDAGAGGCPFGDHSDSGAGLTSKSCCQDILLSIDGQNELQQGHFYSLQPQPVPLEDLHIHISNVTSLVADFGVFSGASPPPVCPDLRILLQSFLI